MSGRAITSLANDRVKFVRALNARKAREETGLFLAEGLKIVTEAVEQGHAPEVLMCGPGGLEHPLAQTAASQAREVLQVTPAILEKVTRRENPQMVVGVFRQVFRPLAALDPRSSPIWIALERARDPGNLGSIVRTCDAAGAGAVILIGECCDPYSVEAVRATMGSIFAVPIVRTDVEAFLEWRARWPGSVVGTRLDATLDHKAAAVRTPSLVLLGNEQAGLTDRLSQACDLNVKIPMRGRADSLNLAIAAGIMIYALS